MSNPAGAARAIADVNTGTILATVDIMVPPERVFSALSDGAEIVRWWGAPGAYTTDSWTTDFRPGGKWRADGTGADGKPFSVGGEFIEIDRPWLIAQTWEPSWTPGLKTVIRYQLTAIDGGTRLVVRQEGFGDRRESCEGHADGWVRVLGWLTGYLSPQPETAAAPLYFLARLLPPRPSFMRDMSPEDRLMMQAHSRYWRGHQDAGKMLIYGPVADPKGGWGVGVMKVASRDELDQLQANDPAILAGRGLSYENLPMPAVVYRNL